MSFASLLQRATALLPATASSLPHPSILNWPPPLCRRPSAGDGAAGGAPGLLGLPHRLPRARLPHHLPAAQVHEDLARGPIQVGAAAGVCCARGVAWVPTWAAMLTSGAQQPTWQPLAAHSSIHPLGPLIHPCCCVWSPLCPLPAGRPPRGWLRLWSATRRGWDASATRWVPACGWGTAAHSLTFRPVGLLAN